MATFVDFDDSGTGEQLGVEADLQRKTSVCLSEEAGTRLNGERQHRARGTSFPKLKPQDKRKVYTPKQT